MEEIEIKNIDHLGIIAGIVDELEIVKKVNERLKIDCREKITSGQVVKAIILNGLGFISRPLYLFSQFPLHSIYMENMKVKNLKKKK